MNTCVGCGGLLMDTTEHLHKTCAPCQEKTDTAIADNLGWQPDIGSAYWGRMPDKTILVFVPGKKNV